MSVNIIFPSWKRKGEVLYRSNVPLTIDTSDLYTIEEWLRNQFGNYALCIESEKDLILAVDSIRSIPIYYCVDKEKEIIVASERAQFVADICKKEIVEDEKKVFLATGYCLDDASLFSDVYQVLPGQYICINKDTYEIRKSNYIKYEYRPKKEYDLDALVGEFDKILTDIFEKLKIHYNNRQIIVPLSGGLDSRTIIYYLKKLKFDNVLCVTYGRSTSYEVEIAKQVANDLNVKLVVCEYNQQVWNEFWNNYAVEEFIKYSCAGSEIGCIQALPAMRMMNEKGIIEDDAIVVPGHALDFLAGGHLPLLTSDSLWKRKTFQKNILMKNCSINKKYKVNVDKVRCNEDILSRNSIIQNYYIWEINNRQSKFIANDVRTYEFMGCEYCLPFWDKNVIGFFMSLPYELLYKRKFQVIFMNKVIDEMLQVKTFFWSPDILQTKFKKIAKKILSPYMNWKVRRNLVRIKDENVDAFYSNLTTEEYLKRLKEYGNGYSINSVVAEKTIEGLEKELYG